MKIIIKLVSKFESVTRKVILTEESMKNAKQLQHTCFSCHVKCTSGSLPSSYCSVTVSSTGTILLSKGGGHKRVGKLTHMKKSDEVS